MATFQGRLIIALPSSPPAPASIEYSMIETLASTTSPFSKQQQFFDWQAPLMEWSLSYPPMLEDQSLAWEAFLLNCRGQANVFQVGDPRRQAPTGTGSGTPVVSGSDQTGYTLVTSGWTPGETGILLPGDYLQIGYRLYKNLTAADADGGGHSTLNIWPNLRESPADGDALGLNNTKGLFCLKSNSRPYRIDDSRNYWVTFEVREAL